MEEISPYSQKSNEPARPNEVKKRSMKGVHIPGVVLFQLVYATNKEKMTVIDSYERLPNNKT